MDLFGNEFTTALPSKTLRITNVITYVLLIFVNIGSALGLFGPTNAEISEKYTTPLTPAGWAFSIWGAIFALQGIGTIYQALPYGYSDGWKARIVNAIGYGWQIGWMFEMAWQLFFVVQTVSGMAICAILLLGGFVGFGTTLLNLYRLKDQLGSLSSPLLYLAFFLPTSMNTAWLSVAAGVGILIVPTAARAEANLELHAAVLAALVTALGAAVLQKERDSAYGLTLVWALVAVYGGQASPLVRGAALVCMVICGTLTMFSVLRRRAAPAPDGPSPDLRVPFKAKASDEAA